MNTAAEVITRLVFFIIRICRIFKFKDSDLTEDAVLEIVEGSLLRLFGGE